MLYVHQKQFFIAKQIARQTILVGVGDALACR